MPNPPPLNANEKIELQTLIENLGTEASDTDIRDEAHHDGMSEESCFRIAKAYRKVVNRIKVLINQEIQKEGYPSKRA